VAVDPTGSFDYLNRALLVDICERWFGTGTFRCADNFLSLTLSVDNQIIHPTRCYSLAMKSGGKWASDAEVPLFYRDYDQFSADTLSGVDQEYTSIRNAIVRAYPNKLFTYMLDYLALERLSYNSANVDVRESFVNSTTLGAIKTPAIKMATGEWVIDTQHRFFTDDIHYGLCIAKWIAQQLGLTVPRIDKIVTWAQTIRGEQILEDGKLVFGVGAPTTGLRLGIPPRYGLHTIDAIID
jgi:hypothetical protein